MKLRLQEWQYCRHSSIMFRGNQLRNASCRAVLAFGVAFIFAFSAIAASDLPQPSAIRAEIDAAIARVKPALVRIRDVPAEYRDGREVKVQEVGSGAIITRDGYIITNHHVAGH